jgi:hypothetical protein
MADFTDVDPDQELAVGMPMKLMFRVKDYDRKPWLPPVLLEGNARQ